MDKVMMAFGEVMMRLEVPGYDLLSQANTLRYSFSGTGVNVAGALAAYGYPSYLISCVPDNPLGSAACSYLRKLGISTEYVGRNGQALGMYFLENGFGPRQSRVTYANRSQSSFNTAPEDLYPWEELAKQMDVLHLCGITLAMNDRVRRQAKTLAAHVQQHNKTVVFDCNYRPSLWGQDGYRRARPHYEEMLRYANVVLMNERDAKDVLGLTLATVNSTRREQLEESIPIVAERYHISVIAGTHRSIEEDGRHAIMGFIYQDGRFTYSKRLTFPVVSRIGTGDAFASGMIHGWLTNMSPKATVDFAVAASMLAHTLPGDTPHASIAEVQQAMLNDGDSVSHHVAKSDVAR